MRLAEFNEAPVQEAAATLRPCIDIDRWVDAVLAGRPFATLDDLATAAEAAANPFLSSEVEAALAHHPRIGERAQGQGREAELSRGEQASLRVDDDIQAQLVEGNRAYEERFGRVFLIRAAGRTSEEILAQLRERLGNDDATEARIVGEQLRQIALVRLKGAIES